MTTRAISFYGSTVGKKVAMAVTGLIVVGWVILHMLGHVAAFAGRETYNEYAAFLADRPPLLWGQRIVLAGALILHIHAALTLWGRNSEARPRAYHQRKDLATNAAALTMRFGGLLILAFIIFHVLTLTVGLTDILGYEFVRGDVYNNLTKGFSYETIGAVGPVLAGFYILAVAALGMHLFHGIWSLTQTLGLDHPKYNSLRQLVAMALTAIVVLGFWAIPISALTGRLAPTDTNTSAEPAAE